MHKALGVVHAQGAHQRFAGSVRPSGVSGRMPGCATSSSGMTTRASTLLPSTAQKPWETLRVCASAASASRSSSSAPARRLVVISQGVVHTAPSSETDG